MKVSVIELIRAKSDTLVKWLRVSRGLQKDKGTENCAFCKLFYLNITGNCKGCPIREKTGRALCNGTPYEKWVDHHNKVHKYIDTGEEGYGIECPECKELARDEFYFMLDIVEGK